MRPSRSIVTGSIVAGLISALPFMPTHAQAQTNGACNVPPLMSQRQDAATIQHLEASWNIAIAQGDASFEDCLLTADFLEILANGDLKTRADELGFTTKNKGQNKPRPRLPAFTVVIHSNVAIAYAIWTPTDPNRRPDKIVDYFIWENGSWHVFFSQSTPVEPQKVSFRWRA
jgi:hypothetical protein